MAADRMPLECLPVRLPELLRHTLDLLQSSATEKGATLSLSVADDLPSTLYGDPLRLRQVCGLREMLKTGVSITVYA